MLILAFDIDHVNASIIESVENQFTGLMVAAFNQATLIETFSCGLFKHISQCDF